MEAELNLDPDSNPDQELITDPDPNLQIISDPAGSGCTTLDLRGKSKIQKTSFSAFLFVALYLCYSHFLSTDFFVYHLFLAYVGTFF